MRRRARQFLDERRRGDDLLSLGQLRLLINVDNFQVVAALKMLSQIALIRAIACVERGVIPVT